MMYPFMTLDDGTVVVHSEAILHGDKESVKVYFEKPVVGGFNSAVCWLPAYRWEDIVGFSQSDIDKYQSFLETVAHVVVQLSREGGFDNAANF
jgi:hypothetical protein